MRSDALIRYVRDVQNAHFSSKCARTCSWDDAKCDCQALIPVLFFLSFTGNVDLWSL